MAAKSKKHAMDMLKQGDKAHEKAMKEMQELMQSPNAMNEWMENRGKNSKHSLTTDK